MSTSDPTLRFSDRAGVYSRCRPGYPAEAIEAIVRGLGEADRLILGDIGAGTGISSRLLAGPADGVGPVVHSVEPNAEMRAAAEPHPRVRWHGGTAEATGLPTGSLHGVVCAQAFHWFRADEALSEFARVLMARTPSGAASRVALVWNVHDDRDEFVRQYRKVILDHATDAPTSPWFTQEQAPLRSHPRFGGYRVERFAYEQVFDAAGLIGRATSSSYLPKEGPGYASLERALRELFARYERDGVVRLPYRTEVHLAELRA